MRDVYALFPKLGDVLRINWPIGDERPGREKGVDKRQPHRVMPSFDSVDHRVLFANDPRPAEDREEVRGDVIARHLLAIMWESIG